MENIFIEKADTLIKELQYLKNKDGYHFRGHRDALNWKLTPQIFREGELDKYIKKTYQSEPFINTFDFKTLIEWFHCNELQEFVSHFLKNNMPYQHFPLPIKRLFQLGAFLLKYNYFLSLYIKNVNDFDFDDETKRILSIHNPADWGTKEKFIGFIQYSLPKIFTLTGLDGNVIQKANLDNIITGYDQTYPQHYDFPTAALDFSFNFYVAIYFALNSGDTNNTSKCFSIYAYKEMQNLENSPVFILQDRSILLKNIRATNQEGTFIFFNQPCSYFLEHGCFPSVDD
jgi:hypothetical protein